MVPASPDQPRPPLAAAVFDFDGTLADTLTEALDIVNGLAPDYGFEPLSREFAESLRGAGVREAIERVGIRPRVLPKLHLDVRRRLKERIGAIDPFPGIPETIARLAGAGLRIGILTSNSADNVRAFLERTTLLPHFEFVIGASSLFGKARHLRRILGEQLDGLAPEHVAYVGDETRDIQAAKKVGLRSVAVAWGLNTHDALAGSTPDHIVQTPDDLGLTLARGLA